MDRIENNQGVIAGVRAPLASTQPQFVQYAAAATTGRVIRAFRLVRKRQVR